MKVAPAIVGAGGLEDGWAGAGSRRLATLLAGLPI